MPLSSRLIRCYCFRILAQVQSQQKGKLAMGGDILKGDDPKKKKKGKKKAAPKKAAKKKAAKKK